MGGLVSLLRRRDVARRWYDAALPPGADPAPFVAPALRAFDQGAAFPIGPALRALEREPAPRLAGATQPALLAWGARDRTHRASDPGSLRGVLPQAESIAFDASGHFPELEAPEAFADAVLAWLDGKGLAR